MTDGGGTAARRPMVGTYELVRRLGVGGMGEVWLARQRGAAGFAREVAIKRLLPQAMEQPDVVSMFIEEAQVTGRLRHPNVVNVIELGAAESGELYLVLEYVDGVGLHKLLRADSKDGRPSLAAALLIARDVALALHAAHELRDEQGEPLGLVHRDVTPSNVMIDRLGHVRLMDFGIAKVRARSHQTEVGVIKGKLAYLAREQMKGSVDPRSDLFSLGLVLWEMLAGRAARETSSDAVLMATVALDDITPIAQVVPDLPPEVAAVVDRACRTEPDERFATGQEMAQALADAYEMLPARPRVERVREQLGALVTVAAEREAASASSQRATLDRTGETGESFRITLHSLVQQDADGVTLSRPLSPDMVKGARPPPGATRGTGVTPSSRLPVAFAVVALAVLGTVVAVRLGTGGARGGTTTTIAATATTTTAATARETRAPDRADAMAGSAVANPDRPAQIAPEAAGDAGSAAGAVATTAPGVPRDAGARTARNARTIGRDGGAAGQAGGVASDAPATLRASSGQIWSIIEVDGHREGESPRQIVLAPGRHSVRFTNPDRQVERVETVDLRPGETRRLVVSLTNFAQTPH